ncbi:unnamed protein product, partial [Ceratitis capitata]
GYMVIFLSPLTPVFPGAYLKTTKRTESFGAIFVNKHGTLALLLDRRMRVGFISTRGD